MAKAELKIIGSSPARMGGVEKLEPAEFHERYVSPGQLDFERSAVV